MHARIGFVVVIGLLLAADDAKDSGIKNEIKKLEGTWAVTGFETDGNRSDEDSLKEWNLVVKGDKYTLTYAGQVEEGTFTIDPKPTPKTVDLTPTTGESAGKTRRGIYELTADRAKTCFATAGEGERPREFAAKSESGNYVWEFKRDKP